MKTMALTCCLVGWGTIAGLVAADSVIAEAGSTATGRIDGVNLALIAASSTSYVSGHETIRGLNSGFDPANSDDKRHGAYGNWPRSGTQWVQYEWSQPINTGKVAVYWFDDRRGVHLPTACRLKYWDGTAFVPVPEAEGLGLAGNRYNVTTFPEVTTPKLRLEFDSEGTYSTGILQWKVFDSGKSPNFPPRVTAAEERVVVLPAGTYLRGVVQDDGKPQAKPSVHWSKATGPGEVTFAQPDEALTTAHFSVPGEYTLRLSANDGALSAADTVKVTVEPPAPTTHLESVATLKYRLHSRFWDHRIKNLIVNWIPHCYQRISDPKLAEGGIENFIQAGNKLAGRPYRAHVGAVFANAWVHNTVEAMCLALMVDPQGDPDIARAQAAMRGKLAEWIPLILSAQEPDGYLQTFYTLSGRRRWSNKWDHEGYTAGYFIESAIAHYRLAQRSDDPMYVAAKKLADCWLDHIGRPPKQAWYDGHEELEQALVRLARLVDEVEGSGHGRKHVELAKFLLDCRRGGEAYDQSQLPVTQQYEAVGHAVRALYCYSAMADVAMETSDPDYYSAVKSIWANLVDKKYYVTGGVGSGETSEGFGPNYSLPNNAYCESCANCGELFFQHKLNLAYHQARYVDLLEDTLYNAILGDLDPDGKNFTYTNPLDSRNRRYGWHGCPCCVGNIARTLLDLPRWMYAKDQTGLYVNLFIGSTVSVGEVAGTALQVVQTTDYPWSGRVTLTLNPANPTPFSLRIRLPSRNGSRLYSTSPADNHIVSFAVNGTIRKPDIEGDYAVIRRTWKAGDRVEFELPLEIQRVRAMKEVAADAGRVALRYGPLIYNIESVDQDIGLALSRDATLTTEWRPELLGGVLVICGQFTNGAPLLAVPNYVRLNRGGRSLVWIKEP